MALTLSALSLVSISIHLQQHGLEGKGIIAREGSIIDATFVEAPRQCNDREQYKRIKEGQPPKNSTPTPP
jgi:transposase, IS5 family